MQITGHNLRTVRTALNFALSYVANELGSFPDVTEYEEDINELRKDWKELHNLRLRVQAAINKETTS